MSAPRSDGRLGSAETARILGVSEASLKRWSDGGALRCERTHGGHRRFARRDVEAFALRLRGGGPDRAPNPEELLRLALSGNAEGIEARLRPGWSGPLQIARLADAAVRPALARVGALWEEGKLSVAEEHLATGAFRRAAAALSGQLDVEPARGRALLACLGREEHDLAAELLAQALRAAGFDARSTGARTPAADVARLVRAQRPALVGVSVSGASGLGASGRALRLLARAAREVAAPLWVGGSGAQELALPAGAVRAHSLEQMVGAALSGARAGGRRR